MSADTNDWGAYYDYGVELLKHGTAVDAEAAFFWAARLAPQRAEPLYGEFVAYFASDPIRFQDYMRDDPKVYDVPAVRRADSLYHEALLRNPMVFQGLFVLAVDQLPGDWGSDPVTLAWLDYASLKYQGAADRWGRAVRKRSSRVWLHYYRALAFVGLARYDSAQAEVTVLLDDLRQRQERHYIQDWASQAFFEYAIALLRGAQHDDAGATSGMQQVLLDDLGFYQAHVGLAKLAMQHGDYPTAAQEYGQAVELAPTNVTARYEYGIALASRPATLADAEPQFRAAIALEPFYADPYYSLGVVLAKRGDSRGALTTFQEFVARAPRSSPNLTTARQLVEQLTQVVRADTTR